MKRDSRKEEEPEYLIVAHAGIYATLRNHVGTLSLAFRRIDSFMNHLGINKKDEDLLHGIRIICKDFFNSLSYPILDYSAEQILTRGPPLPFEAHQIVEHFHLEDDKILNKLNKESYEEGLECELDIRYARTTEELFPFTDFSAEQIAKYGLRNHELAKKAAEKRVEKRLIRCEKIPHYWPPCSVTHLEYIINSEINYSGILNKEDILKKIFEFKGKYGDYFSETMSKEITKTISIS